VVLEQPLHALQLAVSVRRFACYKEARVAHCDCAKSCSQSLRVNGLMPIIFSPRVND
jgi:hypothetical protein